MRYVYDARLKTGARLTSVTVNGKALDDKQTYTWRQRRLPPQAGDGYEVFLRGESADRGRTTTKGR